MKKKYRVRALYHRIVRDGLVGMGDYYYYWSSFYSTKKEAEKAKAELETHTGVVEVTIDAESSDTVQTEKA